MSKPPSSSSGQSGVIPAQVLGELQTIHQRFALELTAALGAQLCANLKIRCRDIQPSTCRQFLESLPSPTCVALLRDRVSSLQIVLEISPLIAFPMLERLLGGSDVEPVVPDRPMTLIERRLLRQIVEKAAEQLTVVWADAGAANFAAGDVETDATSLTVTCAAAPSVLLTFDLTLGDSRGTMSLCTPVPMHLADLRPAELQGKDESFVEIEAILARTRLTAAQLNALEVGDLITTDEPAEGLVTICVAGKELHRGKTRQFRQLRAVLIAGEEGR